MNRIESVKKRVRHQKWREMYEEYLSSGKSVVQWCAENGVSKKTFYYRLRQIRSEGIEEIEHHEIVTIAASPATTAAAPGTIRISCSGIEIELPHDISREVMITAIRGLRSC